jgi:hypothetical protein
MFCINCTKDHVVANCNVENLCLDPVLQLSRSWLPLKFSSKIAAAGIEWQQGLSAAQECLIDKQVGPEAPPGWSGWQPSQHHTA